MSLLSQITPNPEVDISVDQPLSRSIVDTGLIILGVFGLSMIQAWIPALVPVLTWLGIVLLLWLTLKAALRAYQGSTTLTTSDASNAPGRASVLKIGTTTLAITQLNPHVYLDTVVLIPMQP